MKPTWGTQPRTCLGLSMVSVEAVRQLDDVPGCVTEVGDGREGVQAGGVELVAVFHGQLAKGLEVTLPDAAGHLSHACWHQCLCPELQGRRPAHELSGAVEPGF